MNKTMHNLIEERDNIMSGMYDHKLTVSVGTDPREQILMDDSDTQYRKEDFMPDMNKAIKEGEVLQWPVKGLWVKIQPNNEATQTLTDADLA